MNILCQSDRTTSSPNKMEMEGSEDYSASNGQCSPGKENSRMLVDMSAPNGQTAPPGPNSPSEIKIKQEEEMAEKEDNRGPSPEEMRQMVDDGVLLEESTADSPSHTQDGLSGANQSFDGANRQPNGERPFQCNQCGVSFTQKGNLLRHIKLHTGEKPFKCPFCNYACRRRDALTGHLRTHAVGKPHKCNYCGRSYKQRTSLEEHKERCHSYLQGISLDPGRNTVPYTEVPKDARPPAEANAMATYERPPVIEKLNSNLGKRKSTTPQKFVGEKQARYSYPELGYEIGPKFEKQAEMLPPQMMDQAINDAMTYLGTNNLRPLLHHPGPPLSMTEVMPMINPMYHPAVMSLGHRPEYRGNSETLPPQPAHILNHPTSNGPSNALTRQSKSLHSAQEESPSNSGIDSADSARSSPQDKQSYHGSTVPPGLRSRGSPAVHCSNDRAPDASPKSGGRPGAGMIRIPAERSASNEGVRVFGREGNELRAFQCEHCQVLFLDHVMYTIHMGCHGYRDPLECNICGHQSKDRYEFSSHIVRGEHTFH